VRRKHKVERKSATQDDKRLKGVLNKLNVRDIPAIEEVMLHTNTHTHVHTHNKTTKICVDTHTHLPIHTPYTRTHTHTHACAHTPAKA
jgi:hypothetical protein